MLLNLYNGVFMSTIEILFVLLRMNLFVLINANSIVYIFALIPVLMNGYYFTVSKRLNISCLYIEYGIWGPRCGPQYIKRE